MTFLVCFVVFGLFSRLVLRNQLIYLSFAPHFESSANGLIDTGRIRCGAKEHGSVEGKLCMLPVFGYRSEKLIQGIYKLITYFVLVHN